MTTEPDWMNSEIKLAFGSARRSNNIHPGTSVGLMMYHFKMNENITIANISIAKEKEIKDGANSLSLKVGIKCIVKITNESYIHQKTSEIH